MKKLISLATAMGLALAVAACATQPPPDLTPPPKKCDPKTQLESGRKNC